jgi:LysM repeat protein
MVLMGELHRVSALVASLFFAATAVAQQSAGHERHRKSAAPRSRQAFSAIAGARRGHRVSPSKAPEDDARIPATTLTHRIVRGDSMSGIAASYGTSVEAIAALNGLRPDSLLRVGKELLVPQPVRPGGGNDWVQYGRSPEQPGLVNLVTHGSRFRGRLIENGELSPVARRAVCALLGAEGHRPPVPERLLRLLVRVSDTFGGREIRVVSGYRTTSYFADSRHKLSAAIDFSIQGVPNHVLRQYLLLFPNVGVGYYPNSSFVHLDVRNDATQWVDYAGPGEAPRSTPSAPRVAAAPSLSELNQLAEQVAEAMAEATSPHR